MLTNIVLVLVGGFSLYCLSTYIKPLDGQRDSSALLWGILGLVWVALHLRATYSLIFAALPHGPIVFRVVDRVVPGVVASVLICRGWRQGVRAMLILAGVLFVASPLVLIVMLHRIAPGAQLRAIFLFTPFYILEASAIGIAIPAVLHLWKRNRNDGKQLDSGSDPSTAEYPAENGTSA